MAIPHFECLLFNHYLHYYHQNCELILLLESYSKRVSVKETVSNWINFFFHLICDVKGLKTTLKVKRKRHKSLLPNLILLASLIIVEQLIHSATFIFVWTFIILSMQISAFFALMLFKSKINFDEKFWWNKTIFVHDCFVYKEAFLDVRFCHKDVWRFWNSSGKAMIFGLFNLKKRGSKPAAVGMLKLNGHNSMCIGKPLSMATF